MFKSKGMIIVLSILIILIVLFITGRKSVHSEILINAFPNDVWVTLTDINGHKDWNKVLIPQGGEYKVGNKITYQFYEPGKEAVEMSGEVIEIKENELLNQKGGVKGILTFDHRYIIKSEGNNTKVIIHEDYRGIAVNFWNPSSVQLAYDQLIADLKEQVEKNERNE